MTRLITALILALVSLSATNARANPGMVAVIVGVNASVDTDLPALRYADDDAILYRQLFRQLGATTFLLTRLDDNTRRLHPEAAGEARLPRRAALEQVVTEAAAAIAATRARGDDAVFYFVYAGHGNVRDGQSYIGLEDDRLTGSELKRRVLDAVPADQKHVVVDACYSGLLAGTRGPGGERRPLHGFSQLQDLAGDERIGLLLSTSSARESHEWDGFQAGVFSYEVRSGMYGAADADGDGYVSYREIAAFVARANAAIPNERFRPDVYARSPRGSDQLLDLRAALHRRVEIDGKRPGHYVLENELGVRVLDFHNAADQRVAIVRPTVYYDLFLRRIDDNREYRLVADARDVVTIDDLDAGVAHVASRGAAHEAFSRTFLLQFDENVVRQFQVSSWTEAASEEAEVQRGWRRPSAVIALGVGGGASLAAVAFGLSAFMLHNGVSPTESQSAIAERNAKIRFRNSAAAVCGGIGLAAIASGAILLLWPSSHVQPPVLGINQSTAGTALVTFGGAF